MPQETEPTAPKGERSRGRVSVRALLLLGAVALVVYGVDQLAKYLIVANLHENQVVPVLGDILQLHFVTNSGAAFSLAAGFTWILSIVAIGVVVFIAWFARRIRSLAWACVFGLVLGGAVGNLTDRLFREPGFGTGHVVDFIQVWGFAAIFNVADSAIVVAMGVFIILSLRGIGLDGRKAVYVRRTRSAHDPDVVQAKATAEKQPAAKKSAPKA